MKTETWKPHIDGEAMQFIPQDQASVGRKQPNIVVAIPCFNEEPFVGDVVRKVRKYVDEVVVIDDGSHDGTAKAAGLAGAVVESHNANRGYGEAIKSCFWAARVRDADVLLILDGDGQHDPDQLPQFLAPILDGEADMVIGSRFLNGSNGIPAYRKLGIHAITWLFNVGAKTKVSDSQSGFRAFGKTVLDTMSLNEKGMGISVEILEKARKKGLVFQEVPISCSYHPQSSTLNPVRHGLGVAMTVLKMRLGTRCNAGGMRD